MNGRFQLTLTLAAWELRRFVKLRDMIISALIMVAMMGLSYGAAKWQLSSAEPARVAIVSDVPLALGPDFDASEHAPEELPALQRSLREEQFDGILVVDADHAVLHVDKEPAWHGALQRSVSAAIQQRRLDALPVPPAQVHAALAPVPLEIRTVHGDGTSTRTVAMLIGGVMVMALMLGMTYLFVSITGDKQQRVTEQLFGIVPAQALVDGKLLGVAGATVISTAQMAGLLFVAGLVFRWSVVDTLWTMLGALGPGTIALLGGFAALGFAFWFAAWSAIFATIDDPNTSQRSSLMLLPIVPLSLGFLGMSNPDSVAMQVMGQLPLTSMSVMPLRMVASSVSALEIVASLTFLLAAVLVARRLAGALYESAILHHGSEPGVAQMLRWLRTRP